MPTVKPSRRRAALLASLSQAIRRHSTATVLFHAAIAERLGLHPSDHKAADLLLQRGPLTAGELARLTGLTTGAVTGIIDRLEAAGWIRRERDPADRRRVIVTPALSGERLRQTERAFAPVRRALEGLVGRYTDAELTLLIDFLDRTRELVETDAGQPSAPRRRSAARRP